MKAKTPNIKYVAWRSAEDLHEISLGWISELKFIKYEQRFLEILIANYNLQLIEEKTLEKSSKLVYELYQKRKEINILLKNIIKHCNELNILVDGIDQLDEEKMYKENHRQLLIEVSSYFEDYKVIKKNIFDLIKTIIKQNKQKRLLQ